MYSYNGSGRGERTPTYSHPNYQQYDGYQPTPGYQNLRPPPIDTAYAMDDISYYGSSDSGYATRKPSVASPQSQQNYPSQIYQAQGYPARSYGPSTPAPTSPSQYPCLYPNCGHVSVRAQDLKPHMTVHFPPDPEELLDCKYEWCGRTGAHGFKREDHRKEHYRKVHMKENEYPTGKGGRSGWRGRGEASAPSTHFSITPKSKDLMQPKVKAETTTGRVDSVPPSGSFQAPALSPEDLIQLAQRDENLEAYEELEAHEDLEAYEDEDLEAVTHVGTERKPQIYENVDTHEHLEAHEDENPEAETHVERQQKHQCYEDSSDQNSVGFSLPDPNVVMPEASDTDKARYVKWTVDEWSSSEDEIVLDRLKGNVRENIPTSIETISKQPKETIFDREALIASLSYPRTKTKPIAIQTQILTTSSAGKTYTSLKVEWGILSFMQDQFRDHDYPNTVLGSVVTISGSAQQAQAVTCSEYLHCNWPAHGLSILGALQDALYSATHTSHLKICPCNGNRDMSHDTALCMQAEIRFDVSDERVCLDIKMGTPELIADVVQQLAWMGAALRTSVDGGIQYCEPKMEKVSGAKEGEPVALNITFDMTSPGEEDRSCWFPLFKNPVIAHGFPTARRNQQEVGLEISLDMMAALGGARHAMDFEGGLVLKGYSTLFVPMKRQDNSVQWHLICARGDDRISCREASTQCPNRSLLKDLNHDELRTTRAFLGWCKEAETHLATPDAVYDSIEWSKAKEVGSSLRFTGGTLGISKIFTAQGNFVLSGKDGSFHYSQPESFRKTVDRAEKFPILLYDYEDRRAWLVPALSVILHIIQLRNHLKPFVVGGKPVQISPVDLSRQENAAREAVAKNKLQRLFDCEFSEEKDYCFGDAVLDTWSILVCLLDKKSTIKAAPGMAVSTTWQKTLHGWELRAIADEDRLLKLKTKTLKKTAGRWYDLVEDVDAVVLFASGLGDIIKPKSESAGLCRKWESLPKGKDYLAVCVPMLESFYEKAGHRQDHQYLTSAKLQWHRGSMLFEQCVNAGSRRCNCDRLQQVHRDTHKLFGHRTLPRSLEASGCVIFGQGHLPRKLHRKRKKALKSDGVHVSPSTPGPNGGSIKQISTKDYGLLPSSPPTSVSSEPEKVNGRMTQSPTRPPSPVSCSDDFLKDKAKGLETRRESPHTGPSKPDACKGLDGCDDSSFWEDYAICPSEYQSKFKYVQETHRQPFAPTQPVCAFGAGDDKPVHARRPLRRKTKIEDFGNPHGCSCTACLVVQFEKPNSLDPVSISNGTRRNSSNRA